ncbi:protein SpAN-like [Homarus americanus]|uniref:protein SpAN-like n=1 Tax=Homarus americanus TaxID=6706 RepID=UPI001C448C4C|nr:protein SpAN-like [Homarus americanus]
MVVVVFETWRSSDRVNMARLVWRCLVVTNLLIGVTCGQRQWFEYINADTSGGEKLLEADTLMTAEQCDPIEERMATADTSTLLWPDGPGGWPLIPYVFDYVFGNDKKAIREGLNYWMAHTCITFVETTDMDQPHLKFIHGDGCWSFVGRQHTWQGQALSLGDGCAQLGQVAHQLGHAIGFYHEHIRPDRDQYIYIMEDNINKEDLFKFQKHLHYTVDNFSLPYDFTSIMHNSNRYGAFNRSLTIITLDPLAQGIIGQRDGLSHYDKLRANLMYNCTGKWLDQCGLTSEPCQNYGYTGIDCTCVCPPGTSGDYCQVNLTKYYDYAVSSCSEVITEAGNISSPNYPLNYPAGSECVKVIRASECHVPRLTFNDFSLYRRETCRERPCCRYDVLAIMEIPDEGEPGDIRYYCERDISPGQNITSSEREMVVYFSSRTDEHKGWAAAVSFVKSGTCSSVGSAQSIVTDITAMTTTPTTTTTTSTTTITTPTTTATTPTTTTTPSGPRCEVDSSGDCDLWSSPNFNTKKYPNNFDCTFNGKTDQPARVVITANTFKLARGDTVQLNYLYGKRRRYAGKTNWTYSVPSAYNSLVFKTSRRYKDIGFNITICREQTTCHKVIRAESGSSDTISSPDYNTGTRASATQCEWWIMAPEGKTIQLDYLHTRVATTKRCRGDYLVLNGAGSKAYPSSNSTIYCNEGNRTLTFSSNSLFITYHGQRRLTKGVSFKYTIK